MSNERMKEMEQLLLEYVERYGLTPSAREFYLRYLEITEASEVLGHASGRVIT